MDHSDNYDIGPVGVNLPVKEEKYKPKVKCGLPTCDVLTDHNGGYCSAEHCKEDRERRRIKK